MAANELNFNQISTVVASIASQATGKTVAVPTNTSEFVTVGTTLAKIGTDIITKAITTLCHETIFSIRPYTAMFNLLTRSKSKYWAHARKISYGDNGFESDQAFDGDLLVDGASVDHWTIRKGKVVQTNFYGQNVISDHITIFEDQYDFNFTDYRQWGEFISGVLQNIDDKFTQGFENTSRLALLNLIGGDLEQENDAGNLPNVVHLITEYNGITGLTGDDALTVANYRRPDHFGDFAKWVVSQIETWSRRMRERNVIYHSNLNKMDIPRHTPYDRQNGIFYAEALTHMDTNVLSAAYHDNYLKFRREETNFWQSLADPTTVNITPSYMAMDGSIVTSERPVTTTNLFGILFDDEAVGHTLFNEKVRSTSLNARGLYYNIFYHYRSNWWNDNTENHVIFLLD